MTITARQQLDAHTLDQIRVYPTRPRCAIGMDKKRVSFALELDRELSLEESFRLASFIQGYVAEFMGDGK